MSITEGPVRKSLFSNVPPFLNYLPNGKSGDSASPCPAHADTMVDLRESLWRVPMALNLMVSQEEVLKNKRERICKVVDTTVSLPKAFMREKSTAKRKNLFRPRSILIDDENETNTESSSDRYFEQQHDDPKKFMQDHLLVKIAPVPSCQQIARKDYLWKYYQQMRLKYGEEHFNFLSESMNLPKDRCDLEKKMKEEPGTLWIVKPPGKNNGSGIHVINKVDEIPTTEEDICIQRYITNPYLIKSCKFDLRVYVLVTSLEPLRVYIYDEGLVRFAVNEYTLDPEKIKDKQIHVTNFDVNKRSDKFVYNDNPLEPEGHKWTLSGLWKYMSSEVKSEQCLDLFSMWEKIKDLVIKSLLCGLTSIKEEIRPGRKKEMKSTYNFYKIFGYDILLDSKRFPHLIEINSRPAALNDRLDAFVNRPMVSEIFKLVGYHIPPAAISSVDKRSIACSKLNLPDDYSRIGFNPMLYSTVLDDAGIKKQKLYPRNCFQRDKYIDSILNDLTASDVKILVKHMEENSQAKKFSRVFPTAQTHEYFQFFDYLPYYDKLLDAFEERFHHDTTSAIAYIDDLCKKNVHN